MTRFTIASHHFSSLSAATSGGWWIARQWADALSGIQDPKLLQDAKAMQTRLVNLLAGYPPTVAIGQQLSQLGVRQLPKIFIEMANTDAVHWLDRNLPASLATQMKRQTVTLRPTTSGPVAADTSKVISLDAARRRRKIKVDENKQQRLRSEMIEAMQETADPIEWRETILDRIEPGVRKQFGKHWDQRTRGQIAEKLDHLSKHLLETLSMYTLDFEPEWTLIALQSLGIVYYVPSTRMPEPADRADLDMAVFKLKQAYKGLLAVDLRSDDAFLRQAFARVPKESLSLFNWGLSSEASQLIMARIWKIATLPPDPVISAAYQLAIVRDGLKS